MAPIHNVPKPLTSTLKKSSSSSSSSARNVIKPSTSNSSLFPSTKRDKRHIKHAALMSKITKSPSKKPRRRQRRPNKKLVATLDSLAAALPDGDSPGQGAPASAAEARDQVNIIRRKSIKSRPGAMKRREKVDQGERERFAKNLAQMAAAAAVSTTPADAQAGTAEGTAGATSQRWAALRGFIAQTLEQKPELKSNS